MSFLGDVGKSLVDNVFGGYFQRKAESRAEARYQAHRPQEIQDRLELEKMGIQSRVEGAKAAGIHPLVALGLQGVNAPVSVIGGEIGRSSYVPVGNSGDSVESPPPMPSHLTDFTPGGFDEPKAVDPNIERFNSARARREEIAADQAALDYAKSVMGSVTQPGQAIPALNTALSTDSANVGNRDVKVKPAEVVAGHSGFEAGVHQPWTYVRDSAGDYWALPSAKANEGLEDTILKSPLILWKNMPAAWDVFKRWAQNVQEGYLSSLQGADVRAARREVERLARRYPRK